MFSLLSLLLVLRRNAACLGSISDIDHSYSRHLRLTCSKHTGIQHAVVNQASGGKSRAVSANVSRGKGWLAPAAGLCARTVAVPMRAAADQAAAGDLQSGWSAVPTWRGWSTTTNLLVLLLRLLRYCQFKSRPWVPSTKQTKKFASQTILFVLSRVPMGGLRSPHAALYIQPADSITHR